MKARAGQEKSNRGQGVSGCSLIEWWARQGSNLHGLLHRILSPARLPVPPRALGRGIFSGRLVAVNTF